MFTKVFIQHLWKLQLHWDESLPQQFKTSWLDYISKFNTIPHLKFPRYVSMPSASIQIHAFCDASLAAYGACIYERSYLDSNINVACYFLNQEFGFKNTNNTKPRIVCCLSSCRSTGCRNENSSISM